jgi:NADH-quinone oxidoreductase subunit F
MSEVHRVLPPSAFESLQPYLDAGGGAGLWAARAATTPDAVIDVIEASGLRGRGGAGFPTGRKWRTVAANRSEFEPSTVVVNAAEGEPGSFKDRAILRSNPYAVLEGALIAAHAVGANQVIVAMKRTFRREIARVGAAITQLHEAGWCAEIDIEIFEGPSQYLYGEETALLEAIDGREPFPRVTPPFRRGVDEVAENTSDVASESGSAVGVELAGPGSETVGAPALASNVETYANVPGIVAHGAEWFRSLGTAESPGTIVCTVSGRTQHAGVAEVVMGTPLRQIIETIGGGAQPGRHLTAVMSGVANAIIPEALLDTPASYETLAGIGSGLGAAGFLVFDDTTDLVAVAAGVARFLAVESCGQCTPCKRNGLAIADMLARVARSEAEEGAMDELASNVATVADSARCNLATQQQVVVGSLLELFPHSLNVHVDNGAPPVAPEPIAAILELEDGVARLDEHELAKQPDWTYDETDSGKWPASRLGDPRIRDSQL